MDARGLASCADMWEEYMSDPSTQPDPATWRTRLILPVC
jgi:effector-binding domain-containing protein